LFIWNICIDLKHGFSLMLPMVRDPRMNFLPYMVSK
jgi:hypothetical protein